MAISVVQSKVITSASSGSFNSNVTAGNTVFLVIGSFNSTGSTISTSAPTFGGSTVPGVQLAGGQGKTGSNVGYMAIWMLPNLAGGAASVGVTLTNGSVNANAGIIIYEVAGLGPYPLVDKSAQATGNTGTAVSSGASGNIIQSPDFVLGGFFDNATGTGGPPGSPWTSLTLGASKLQGAGYQLPATAGSSYTFSVTGNANGEWCAAVIALYAGGTNVATVQGPVRAWAPVPDAGSIIASPLATTPLYPGQQARASTVQWGGRARAGSSPILVSVQNPGTGPVFVQWPRPAQARRPLPPAGRVASNPGGPVRNPAAAVGPVFYPAVQPARARILQNAPRGRAWSNPGGPVQNPPPTPGPPFRQAAAPARIRIPQNAPRGRTWSNPGGPVQDPSSGPRFNPFRFPARIHPSLPPRGRAASNPGGPVQNPVPTVGPVFYPRNHARARQPLPRRGTCRAIRFYPLSGNPTPGPVFRQATSPAQAKISWIAPPPRGRTWSNPGGPVQNPFQIPGCVLLDETGSNPLQTEAGDPLLAECFRIAPPLLSPVRAPVPQTWSKGRVGSNPGAPVQNPPSPGPVFVPKNFPARCCRITLPPRGRTAGSPGAPVHNPPPGGTGPVFRPATQAVRAWFTPPRKGRHRASQPAVPVPVAAPPGVSAGQPAGIRVIYRYAGRTRSTPQPYVQPRNPAAGPVFVQAVQPARCRIPQNGPRGRTGSNPGGPVANIPLSSPLFRLGVPGFQWAAGTPVTSS